MNSNRIYTNGTFLLSGSNLGDRLAFLSEAEHQIVAQGVFVLRKSAVYETKPWGSTSQNDYLNQVWEISTRLDAFELLHLLKSVELNLGRNPNSGHYADRCIDLDILYFSSLVVYGSTLQIPHPRIQQRKFALLPMVELEPGLIHPVLNKSQLELLEICEDPLEVRLFSQEP